MFIRLTYFELEFLEIKSMLMLKLLWMSSITLQDAHDAAEKVHNDIEKTFPKAKHIMVHVNPAKL